MPLRTTSTNPAAVSLTTKIKPRQSRALDTVELILETAGALLEEGGLEQLTTNAICKRSDISPPALYRYFPNKYSILKVLGERLMQEQDEAVYRWIERGGLDGQDTEAMIARLVEVITEVTDITRNYPGNVAIMRAIRAAPVLHEYRITSRDQVVQRLSIVLARAYPAIPVEGLHLSTKLAVELIYAAIEMVLEEHKPNDRRLIEETSRAFVAYFDMLQARGSARA